MKIDQFTEPQMTRERRGLSRNPFHQITVANQGVGVMINNLMVWSVIAGSEIIFGDRHADAVCESLAERTCRHFHTGRQSTFGVTRSEAAPLTKLFDLFERQVITSEVKQTI